MLRNKHIILGITGSIAAYKAAYIIRGLVKKGAEVQVVITPSGKEFITPLTLSTLSSHPVISEFFSNRDGTWNSHVGRCDVDRPSYGLQYWQDGQWHCG